MTSARDLLPALRTGTLKLGRWTRLVVPAVVLTILFGLMAFSMLVWRDQGHTKVMVNDQVAPTAPAPARQTSATVPSAVDHSASVTKPSTGMAAPAAQIPGRNPFTLTGMNSLSIGTIRLRLLRTNIRRKTYELNVHARRHSRVHRNLKAGEPVWIAGNRGESPIRVVVSSISKEDVSGYWEELGRPAQGAARNVNHHP